METSRRHQETQNPEHHHYHHHHHHHHQQQQQQLPSPNSSSSSTNSSSNGLQNQNQSQPPLPSPKPMTRSETGNPYPTTFVQADTSSFKQVVQMLTGSPKPASHTITATHNHNQPDPAVKTHPHTHHNIPPIKSIPKKNQSSGFKLYERRNSLKNLKINPLNPIFAPPTSGFSPRKAEILSPSILDFPALVLSPVTPLIPDPFDRSGPPNYTPPPNCFSPMNNNNYLHSNNNNVVDGSHLLFTADAEEKAIKERGFYLHPSPATTPRETEPRLLPLFPVTSPKVSGSANPTST